jgi:hypothetical protein
MEHLLPKMADALSAISFGPKGRSLRLILFLPLVSAFFFLFPKWLTIRFSKRTHLLGEPIFTESGWYFLGYLLIFLYLVVCMGFV